MNDDFFMSLAICKAWEFQILTYPNPAVGCVIVDKNGKILAIEAHEKAGQAHAELNAIRSAILQIKPNLTFPNEPNELYEFILKNHSNLLSGARAYVTLEPCSHYGKTPPCAILLRDLKFSEVIIATADKNKIASGGAQILKNAGISVKTGILEQKAQDLISSFLAWQKGNFSFFKLALSANGVAVGAKNSITNELSRTHVHKLRSVCELLVTGGNTVRIDTPTFDSRLAGDKAPNLMIFSKQDEFNKSIPLFGVPNRSMKICRDLSKTKTQLTMFEGGENLLNAVKDEIDMFLIFYSSKFLKEQNLQINLDLKPLFSGNFGDDRYVWYVKK
ncbi:MAG: bifunctional diaminohydroxyphosphoribosylaminopyrimidine deaminase/5-amino-6-(5-phosphoribosylamino)uracil reductase RibD [Campylobacter sp.]